jgi:hypothetical protein
MIVVSKNYGFVNKKAVAMCDTATAEMFGFLLKNLELYPNAD